MALSLVLALTPPYVDNFKILLYTLAATTNFTPEDCLYVCSCGLNSRSRQELARYVAQWARSLRLYFIDTSPASLGYASIKRNFKDHASWHLAIFLARASQLDALDTILYLDLQTLVMSDVKAIQRIDMNDQLLATSLHDIAPYEAKRIFRKMLAYENNDSHYAPLSQPGFLTTSAMIINLKMWRSLDISAKFLQFVQGFPAHLYRSCSLGDLLHYYLYTRYPAKVYHLPTAFNSYKLYVPERFADARMPEHYKSWVRLQVSDTYAHDTTLDRATLCILTLNSGRWAKPRIYRKPLHALIEDIAQQAKVPIQLQSLRYSYYEACIKLEEHLHFAQLYLPRLLMVVLVTLAGVLSSTLLLILAQLFWSVARRVF
jgi:lipopolysaccharide biosynthesis glycosyltransferase